MTKNRATCRSLAQCPLHVYSRDICRAAKCLMSYIRDDVLRPNICLICFFLYWMCEFQNQNQKSFKKNIFIFLLSSSLDARKPCVYVCVNEKPCVCWKSYRNKTNFFFIYLNKYHNIVRCLSSTCSMGASNLRLSRENSHILRKPYIFHKLKLKKTI